ncbi:hypothetical protein [Plastoroseomonas arctica]|uniref:Uncharacterized protein n=1 Tax=Plastoroseomonas arctica TaxID=1509237 RepID=A0AAF1JU47_9PROT|nr:hypothetical protein [Plastoroseomonas arctica]MBR0653611.1 hypothetical protein [Plastoroseomonas arctica]
MGAMRLTLDLPEALSAGIAALAASEGRSPEAVALAVPSWRIADFEEARAELAQAEADIAAGLIMPHDEVMEEMRGWAAALRARKPG